LDGILHIATDKAVRVGWDFTHNNRQSSRILHITADKAVGFGVGYMDCGQKCDILFNAQRDIALEIPDVEIAWTHTLVTLTKEKLKRFRRTDSCQNTDTGERNLPPPYSEYPLFNPFYDVLAHYVHKRSTSNASISFFESKEETKQPQALSPRSHVRLNLENTVLHALPTTHACTQSCQCLANLP
jgi:hypothetical protein